MTAMPSRCAWISFPLAIGLLAGPALAQPKPAPKKPAESKEKPTDKQAEPTTVEAAARVLDLRKFPLMEGVKDSGQRTMGMLMYQAKGSAKAAYEFQKKQLLNLGFKELPGGYSAATSQSGQFAKEGFQVAVSASETSGEVYVSLLNSGNVAVARLPVPPGSKPFHPEAMPGAYLTDAKVADAAAACRKLLLAAGWEPYGRADANNDESSMLYFKRNAIKVMSWVSTAPAEANKTLIRYSAELLQCDLPVPPEVEDPEYTDFQKTLRYDSPQDQTDAILAFYQQRLPKQGWKATTERPVVDDQKKTQFLIFRNSQKDLLSLDLAQFTDIVRVKLSHQTAAEVAEEEKRFKEEAERKKAELAKKNKKINLVVPLPDGAEELEHDAENLVEFKLASGSGPAALGALRDHFAKAGWAAEKGARLEKNAGSIDMKKDDLRLSLSYFDTGLTPVEIRITAPKNVVLEPASAEKPADPKKKPEKKVKPAIPGLPDLPPGVDLPDDVSDLIKKALKEAEDAKPKSKPKR